ncbi:hypothetical protein RI367_002693 [Sorochytrium milnesiophthora]
MTVNFRMNTEPSRLDTVAEAAQEESPSSSTVPSVQVTEAPQAPATAEQDSVISAHVSISSTSSTASESNTPTVTRSMKVTNVTEQQQQQQQPGKEVEEQPAAPAAAPTPTPRHDLQRENMILQQTIKEYESTLEVIMSKYRAQVTSEQSEMKREAQEIQREHQVRLMEVEDNAMAVMLENSELREQLSRAEAVIRTALQVGEEEEQDMIRGAGEMEALVQTWTSAMEAIY